MEFDQDVGVPPPYRSRASKSPMVAVEELSFPQMFRQMLVIYFIQTS